MHVRFDPDANETREFIKGESDMSGTENLDSSTNSQATQTLSPPDTPELEGQKVFSSPKKTPTIRVLDAYGNEQPEEGPSSPKEKSMFRIVDALGETVKEGASSDENSQSFVVPSETRDELLSRVRRSLDELASDMHETERATALSSSELTRVKELDSVSLRAREKRRRLSKECNKQDRTVPLGSNGGTNWHFTSARFFLLVLLQIVLAVIMYRLSDSRVEELFKTAYYDPFQPHLYQHVFKTRLLLSTSPDSAEERRDSRDSGSDTDGTNETALDEDFDWDRDDESQVVKTEIKAKRGRAIWLAFMKLSRPFRVFLIAFLGVAILVTPLIIVNVRFRASPVKIHVHVWSLWFTINWATSCGTYIFVDFLPHLVIALTSMFGGSVERFKMQLELVMAVKGWLKLTLDAFVWAWVALSVIRAVYHPPGSYWMVINEVMQALFAAGMVILAEKLFLHFVAITFHQQALADRLEENRLALRALDHLSRSPYVRKGDSGKKSAFASSADLLNGSGHGHKRSPSSPAPNSGGSHQKKGSKSAPSIFSQERRRGRNVANVIVDQLGDAIGQVALKNSKFNKEVDLSGISSARRLARKLFASLSDVYPPRSHLVVEDFYPYFRSTAEAHQAFELFDKDRNGDISKREMRESVQRIYRERKALVASLKDASSIVAKLDAVCLIVAVLIIIFICLLIFKKNNSLSSLVPLATVVLGFSFVFGNSAQTLFESLIFIFSTHVFDVGDLVMIDDQILFVKEFGLFATTFTRVDGQEVIAPNSLLSTSKLVHNLRRSKSMWETTNLMISYNTPMELVEQLRQKLDEYITANSREWSNFALNIDKMEFQNALHLIVAIEHRPNWQDWGGRWTRRNAFMRYLKITLEELDIRYTMPVQPVLLPSSTNRPPIPDVTVSSRSSSGSATAASNNDLGNAGYFQAESYGRASGTPVFRPGVPSFGQAA
ncbi:hypothetical protein NMY22_g14005 [Coprinellus aureogranulatus]|nr:hypothetical protein NMY22_g14005 [Coprinellus aureogranulatus]